MRVDHWTEDIRKLADSEEFDWIDIKPVIKDPKTLVMYVPRCKICSFLMYLGPLFVHLISAIICMGFSATFHLFTAHSEKVNSFLARIDYCGISILIAGSNTPPMYYSFFCEET